MDLPRLLARVRELLSDPLLHDVQTGAATDVDPIAATVAGKLVELARTQDALADLARAVRLVRPARVRTSAPGDKLRACVGAPGGEPIGEGQFGRVFRLGKDRAVKTVRLAPPPDEPWRAPLPDALRLFLREAQWSRRAGRLGVGPRVHDAFVCVHEGEPHGFLVMDRVRGRPFSRWRATAAPDAVREAERMFAAKAKKMHAAGVVHGDLHAGNVMVVGTRTAVRDVAILDFGFARSVPQMFEDDVRDFAGLRTGRMPRADGLASRIARALINEGLVVPSPAL